VSIGNFIWVAPPPPPPHIELGRYLVYIKSFYSPGHSEPAHPSPHHPLDAHYDSVVDEPQLG
jgi:hypothetical protein